MKAILAIAVLAMRASVRSRVVACLLVLLGLAVVGLPLTVKGDGTIGGYVQILLSYTLGFGALLLSLATMWAGCAAVSTEISSRRLQLVAVKPVPRPAIWLGKWLGLLGVNTLLLLAVGAATYGLLRWKTREGQLQPGEAERLRSEVLVARRMVAPAPFDVDAQARALLQERVQRGELPPEVNPADALEALRKNLLIRAHGVAPGAGITFSFTLPAAAAGSGRPALEYKFAASRLEAVRVAGQWRLTSADGATRWTTNLNAVANAAQELRLPMESLALAGRVDLQYVNTDPRGITLLFDVDHAPRLLLPAGSFEGNFLRTLGILWARLAFLSAIGLLAGSLFSMPVAAFFSLYAIVLLQAAGYVDSLSHENFLVPWRDQMLQPVPTAGDHALRLLFSGLAAALRPLQEADPLARLASGELVGWDWLARTVVVKAVLYSGLLALLAGLTLNRRELALPTDT